MAKPSPAKLLALKTLVVVLGVAILISAGFVAYGVATRFSEPAAQGRSTTPPPDDPVSVALPAGVTVLDSDLDGDRILLRLRLPDNSERLVIYDAVSGAQLGVINLRAP